MLPGRRCAAVLAVAALVLLPQAPARAHASDPQVVTVLDRVEPALPEGVVVQVAAGVAVQLVADNPTDRPLEVLGEGGRPFLRLSRRGVEGDVGSPDLATSGNPVGGGRRAAGPVRWTLLSRGTSWGWFDHRLHPADLGAPADRTRAQELAGWSVALRYGGRPVTASGQVRFAPVRGTLQVTVDPPPPGVQAQVLQGRLPGLFLSAAPGTSVTVLGADGEPFVELGPVSRVNTASRTHVGDRQARGEAAGPAGGRTVYAPLTGPSHSWLDARLAADGAVPDAVVRAGRTATLRRWEVPVVVDGRPAALGGEVRWVPSADLERAVSSGDVPDREGPPLPLVGGGAVVALLGAVVVARRRRAR